jgi:DNA helicase-2/ATP-dependent DNA helicase PcrA
VAPRTSESGILSALNDPQREAVEHGDGPLLIFAGAGSGKTRVLTYRMAYLIKARGVPADRILAVTFTNKAAGEMKERIARLVGGVRWGMWVGTFHSMCARMLRDHIDRLGRTANFVVFDEADQLTLMKEVLKDLEINPEIMPPARVLGTISNAKNELIAARQYESTANSVYERTVGRAYTLYQQRLAENNALDFDDLIMFAVQLFEGNPDLLADYQEKFLHVLVDEFQDINFAQYRFVQMLAAKYRNLAVVGDDDQSIYAWRGADMRIILKFEQDYPDATVVKLEQNYRSTPNILDAAYHVISRNLARKEKRLWTDKAPGPPIVLYQAADEHQEAVFVANTIQELTEMGTRQYADCALLYRINAQSRVLEKVFISLSIPYRIIGGVRFYERKEIKDVLSYLRVIVNPFDSVSLRRIINTPPRGIGDVTLQHLESVARERGMDLLQVTLNAKHLDFPPRSQEAVAAFGQIMARLLETSASASLTTLVAEIIEESGYRAWLEHEGTVQARTRLENVEELLSATQEYETQNEEGTPAGFLEQVALLTGQDELEEGVDAVPLMTLHSAKGLEFPVVFIVGMEEGLFPLQRSIESDNANELEEERRLCYVGMTRAKEQLYLTLASHRSMYGVTRPTAPSRFLADIPEELISGGMAARPRKVTWAAADTAAEEARQIVTRHAGPDAAFKPGDRVRHEAFGEGMVISFDATGDKGRVTVAFPKQGVKKLDLDYAPLEKVK